MRHFSGELAVPFAGDLRPDFQNSQPLNFFKNGFFHLSVFFCFLMMVFFKKPSFDTARFQINIRGLSVIWIPRSRGIRTMARGTKGRRKDQFWPEDELHSDSRKFKNLRKIPSAASLSEIPKLKGNSMGPCPLVVHMGILPGPTRSTSA